MNDLVDEIAKEGKQELQKVTYSGGVRFKYSHKRAENEGWRDYWSQLT